MKRLIICCDGTWQDLEKPYPTNVVKMAQAIKPVSEDGITQIVYYDEGIGTSQGVADRSIKIGGGAFGWGIDHKIQDAYRFLCMNYEDGDEIYLFGFSRGAYTVRSLAGLIHCSGLLKREFIRKVPQAYKLYRDRAPEAAPSGEKAVLFRQGHGENVPIKALCCWDTVGSLGVPDLIPYLPLDNAINGRYRFFDCQINHLIENAFHAVAIDEIRKVFDVTPMEANGGCKNRVTKWFPGTHGCVGGGSEEERGLSDAALLWMMQQVEKLGLALDRNCVEDGIETNYKTPFKQPEGFYKYLGTKLREVKCEFSDLHESVKQRWQDPDCHYRPENLKKFQKELDAWNQNEESKKLVTLS